MGIQHNGMRLIDRQGRPVEPGYMFREHMVTGTIRRAVGDVPDLLTWVDERERIMTAGDMDCRWYGTPEAI